MGCESQHIITQKMGAKCANVKQSCTVTVGLVSQTFICRTPSWIRVVYPTQQEWTEIHKGSYRK